MTKRHNDEEFDYAREAMNYTYFSVVSHINGMVVAADNLRHIQAGDLEKILKEKRHLNASSVASKAERFQLGKVGRDSQLVYPMCLLFFGSGQNTPAIYAGLNPEEFGRNIVNYLKANEEQFQELIGQNPEFPENLYGFFRGLQLPYPEYKGVAGLKAKGKLPQYSNEDIYWSHVIHNCLRLIAQNINDPKEEDKVVGAMKVAEWAQEMKGSPEGIKAPLPTDYDIMDVREPSRSRSPTTVFDRNANTYSLSRVITMWANDYKWERTVSRIKHYKKLADGFFK